MRILYRSFILFFAFSMLNQSEAQVTHYADGLLDGYMLFQTNFDGIHLINNCGEKVNTWEIGGGSARYHPKLLPNGNLIYIRSGTNTVYERDWNDNIVNQVTAPTSWGGYLDYEVILLPNQNYLCLGRQYRSEQEFIDMGYNIGVIGNPNYTDVVLELDRNTGEIKWIWNIADHAIQERDSTVGNYGVVKDNPQLLDMDRIGTYDWTNGESFMINGMDYNVELDQIMLSVRKMGEVVIIDHSTTTAEAAGHTGGNSGKGGDILYRWGNPQNYGQGNDSDRYLYYQHNPNWIHHGEHIGAITMYNNGLDRPGVSFSERYSSVPIVMTSVDANGNYILEPDMPFAEVQPLMDYSRVTTGNDFYSSYTSGGKVLPNGNIFITIGGEDKALELLPDGTLVWEYEMPFTNSTFRSEKYAADYPAFDGKELIAFGTVEGSPTNFDFCSDTVVINATNELVERQFKVWLDGEQAILNILPDGIQEFQFHIFDSSGKRMTFGQSSGKTQYDLNGWISGVYAVQILDLKEHRQETIKIFVP